VCLAENGDEVKDCLTRGTEAEGTVDGEEEEAGIEQWC